MTAPEQARQIREAARAIAAAKLALEGIQLEELTVADALELGISAGASAVSDWYIEVTR